MGDIRIPFDFIMECQAEWFWKHTFLLDDVLPTPSATLPLRCHLLSSVMIITNLRERIFVRKSVGFATPQGGFGVDYEGLLKKYASFFNGARKQ